MISLIRLDVFFLSFYFLQLHLVEYLPCSKKRNTTLVNNGKNLWFHQSRLLMSKLPWKRNYLKIGRDWSISVLRQTQLFQPWNKLSYVRYWKLKGTFPCWQSLSLEPTSFCNNLTAGQFYFSDSNEPNLYFLCNHL